MHDAGQAGLLRLHPEEELEQVLSKSSANPQRILSMNRKAYFVKDRIIGYDELMERIIAARQLGLSVGDIAMRLGISFNVVQKICRYIAQSNSEIIRQDHRIDRYGIVSQHPFPLGLADECILERLEGPWVHAGCLDDSDYRTIQARIAGMRADYGWIEMVRLVPVDRETLVEKGWTIQYDKDS